MYYIRLISNDLLEKVMENVSIFISPTIISEITIPRHKKAIEEAINNKKITEIEITPQIEEEVYKLFKRHKGKEKAIDYRNGRNVRDLGEYEAFGFLLINSNYNEYIFLTLDKPAKVVLKSNSKLRPNSYISKEQEREIMGLTSEEIETVYRGYNE